MAKAARNMMVTAAMAAVAIAMPRTSQAGDAFSVAPSMSHIRTTDARVEAVMQSAFDRSATFRKMVAIIDASDSYVYVQGGKCSHGVKACFVSVSASTTNRYLRVIVDSGVGELDLTRLIAHELRHTIEVIAEPSIRSGEAMYYFYERTAIRAASDTHETRAAIAAGETVQSEIEKSNRRQETR
jgi:hypothetical protein